MNILNLSVQLMVPFLLGIFSARALSRPEKIRNPLNSYIVYIGLPLFLIEVLVDVSFEDIVTYAAFSFGVLLGLTGAAAAFALWKYGTSMKPRRASFLLCGVYGNTGFLGIPVALALFGKEGVAAAVVYSICTTIVQFTLGMITSQSLFGKAGYKGFKKVLRFPSLYIVAAVLFVSRWEIHYPLWLSWAAESTIYLAPFIIGMTCEFKNLEKDFLWLGLVKMLVPGVLVLTLGPLTGIQGVPLLALATAASLPPALVNTSLAIHFDYDDRFAAETTSLLTFLYMSAIMVIGLFFR